MVHLTNPGMSMDSFRGPIADEALWREIEKEQIRLEMISGRIAWRRQLEEEVRRELAIERAFGIPMERYLAAATPYSFQEPMNPFVVDDMSRIIGEEIKPSSSLDINKDKVIMLARPDPDLHSAKRKAEIPAVNDTKPSAFGLRKKTKEEWKCAVCRISVTSERQLNDHQRGKPHKTKEAALETQMTGESTKTCMSSKESETAIEKAGEVNSLATREEVRNELAFGIPMQKCLADPASFQERVTKCLVDDVMDVSEAPVEVKRSSEIDKGKVIMLTKPDPDLYSAKQKTEASAVYGPEPSEIVMKKNLKGEWSCALCQVSATSERGLMEHRYGKKHKNKEAALRTQKIDNSIEASLLSKENGKGVKATETNHTANSGYTKADRQMLPPFVTLEDINGTVIDKVVMESSKNEEQLVEKTQTTGGLKNQNQNESTIEEVGEISALRKRKEEKEELAMESASGIQCLTAPFPFQEPVAKLSNPIMNSVMVDDVVGASQLQLPEIVTPVEVNPSPQNDNDKAILAKCDPHLHEAKQKAVAPAVDCIRSSELKKKPNEKWSCALCGVSATSEKNLNDHLHSKKHRAKEIAQEIQKLRKKSEKSLKATEVVLVAPPTSDPNFLAQFPQPSFT